MNDLASQGLFSGAILVARDGKILISRGYGMADWEQQIPNTAQTHFRLASLTKPITALAVMMLHARGELNIHDSICTYLPDCPETWQPVTVRHLLTHTSGIPNYTDFFEFESTEMVATTPEELIARFRDMPLLVTPGEAFYYDNSGYVLLGVIIEQVSGQTYEDFLQTNIFQPLQMHNSGYDHNVDVIRDQAIGYVTPENPAPFLHTSTLHAAGSLYSTVEDMYRLDQALYTDYLLPQPLRDEMFTPLHYGYGYGWKIQTVGERRVISHPGFINGFSNYIARYPDEQVFVIVLSNLQTASSQQISEYLAQLVFDSP
jgi:CubicO group peptidase (beta-lactamase class C family)